MKTFLFFDTNVTAGNPSVSAFYRIWRADRWLGYVADIPGCVPAGLGYHEHSRVNIR